MVLLDSRKHEVAHKKQWLKFEKTIENHLDKLVQFKII